MRGECSAWEKLPYSCDWERDPDLSDSDLEDEDFQSDDESTYDEESDDDSAEESSLESVEETETSAGMSSAEM